MLQMLCDEEQQLDPKDLGTLVGIVTVLPVNKIS